MAEVMGILLRRKPKQIFTLFISWNLSALWRRIKKLQWPWAPYNKPPKQEFPKDYTTKVPKRTEKYVRPTSAINPYAPEIVALAVKLGLHEKSKREYAETAYDWTKNNICFYMETPPNGAVNTLKDGYGICMNKMTVLAALARVAGIPARFVEYKQEMAGGFMEMIAAEMFGGAEQELVQEIQDKKPTFTHGCVELLLDDEWVSADITWTDVEEVGLDMPISQFGESPFGKWYYVVPESRVISEDPPTGLSFRIFVRLNTFLLRGVWDRVNERVDRLRETGKNRLEEMGREAYIESKKKFYVPPPPLISED